MRRGVERGAERNVHERDTQSYGQFFFGPESVKLKWTKWAIFVFFASKGKFSIYPKNDKFDLRDGVNSLGTKDICKIENKAP